MSSCEWTSSWEMLNCSSNMFGLSSCGEVFDFRTVLWWSTCDTWGRCVLIASSDFFFLNSDIFLCSVSRLPVFEFNFRATLQPGHILRFCSRNRQFWKARQCLQERILSSDLSFLPRSSNKALNLKRFTMGRPEGNERYQEPDPNTSDLKTPSQKWRHKPYQVIIPRIESSLHFKGCWCLVLVLCC